jgi:hypothetical protein
MRRIDVNALPREVVSRRAIEEVALNNKIGRHGVGRIDGPTRPGIPSSDSGDVIVSHDLQKAAAHLCATEASSVAPVIQRVLPLTCHLT